MHSKTKIDLAGRALSKGVFRSEDEEIEAEIAFDDYRRAHLQPLTETTYLVQNWLSSFDKNYYIAQRLKRRPQILRKMSRFSVRLTQLQDIAGNRIIVDTNHDVEALRRFLHERIDAASDVRLYRETDYRAAGRDDTGYRALHLILEKAGLKVELQLRSAAQHYWAEAIERSSVIYGFHLKENEGDTRVLGYFKSLSQVFFELEAGREPTPQRKMDLDDQRELAERLIVSSKRGNFLYTRASEGILQTLAAVERGSAGAISNWILVFDWNTGQFVSWESISRNLAEAYKSYNTAEIQYGKIDGFEVVLVGSSDVSMIKRTHSHYFGIEGYDSILESLEDSIAGFSRRKPLSTGARRVLHALLRKRFWGRNTVSYDTLANHYCRSVRNVGDALRELAEIGLLNDNGGQHGISLQPRKRDEIESYL